jgi:hypothetical protein
MKDYRVDQATQEKMNAACGQQEATAGRVGFDEPCAAPSFRERLTSRRDRAARESRKFGQVDELLWLLDKHPEVARILELIEIVGA